jgi:hypothetical protein
MKPIYKVRTQAGITFHIEASNYQEAQLRASSPTIAKHIALLMQQALSEINFIEPLRGPKHLVKGLVFDEAFFNK